MSAHDEFKGIVSKIKLLSRAASAEELMVRHVYLRELVTLIEALQDEHREYLQTLVVETAKRKLLAGTVERRATRGKAPDEKGLRAYMIESGVDPEQVFVPRKAFVFAPDRLAELIETGHLEEERVNALYPEKEQLRITSDRKLVKELREVRDRALDEEIGDGSD